ncbi:hypothetical protein P4S73_16300 [Paraglaciecola sp. Hal342]
MCKVNDVDALEGAMSAMEGSNVVELYQKKSERRAKDFSYEHMQRCFSDITDKVFLERRK